MIDSLLEGSLQTTPRGYIDKFDIHISIYEVIIWEEFFEVGIHHIPYRHRSIRIGRDAYARGDDEEKEFFHKRLVYRIRTNVSKGLTKTNPTDTRRL